MLRPLYVLSSLCHVGSSECVAGEFARHGDKLLTILIFPLHATPDGQQFSINFRLFLVRILLWTSRLFAGEEYVVPNASNQRVG